MKRDAFLHFSHRGVFTTTYLLKRLDAFLGGKAVDLLAQRKKRRPFSVKNIGFPVRRILVIRPGGIGDAVLLIPALNLLNENFPESEIHVLAERRNRAVFSMVEFVKTYCYDSFKDLTYVLKTPYDLIIDTEQWHRLSAVLSYFINGSIKIGFGTNERSLLFDCSVPYSQNRYELDSFLELLKPLAISAEKRTYIPFLSLSCSLNPFGKDAFVAIFPGASIPERVWPQERFKKVGQWLNKLGFGVAVVGGAQDIALGEAIVNGLRKGYNLAGKCSLEDTAGLLKEASLLISSDSGIMHLAVAVGTPVVALFGPGIENKWAPRDGKSMVLNRHLPCSPCTLFGYTPPCPIGAKCMLEISIDDVKKGILQILSKTE